jgi:hypothetical protein
MVIFHSYVQLPEGSNDHMMMLLLGSKTWRGMPRRSRPGWDGRMDKKEVDGPQSIQRSTDRDSRLADC